MNQLLARLLRLQSVDAAIASLEKELASEPRLLERARKKLQQRETTAAALNQQRKDLTKATHSKEVELKSYEERIQRHKMQLNVIRSNKEYAAITHEIKSEEADQSRVEDAILEILEQIEQVGDEIRKTSGMLEKERVALDSVVKEIETRSREIKDELGVLRARRREAAQAIDPEVLGEYEKVFSRVGPTAVAPIEGSTCTGCNMSVTAQTVNNILSRNGLVRCTNCRRILCLKPEEYRAEAETADGHAD